MIRQQSSRGEAIVELDPRKVYILVCDADKLSRKESVDMADALVTGSDMKVLVMRASGGVDVISFLTIGQLFSTWFRNLRR